MTTRRPPTVAEEIHQSRPFQSPGHELVLTLFRTAAVIERHNSGPILAAGVSLPQYNVLRILRGAGEAGLPTLSIRDRLVDLSPGITRLIDKLEESGLVTRERDPEDRRQVVCRITAAGLALLAQLDPTVAANDASVAESLSATEQRTLVRLLDQVRAGLNARLLSDH